MNHEVSSLTSGFSPITDSGNSTGPTPAALAESFFQRRVVVFQPRELRESDAATLDYSHHGVESSTSQDTDSGELEKNATALFASAKEQIFEDGMESDFSREIAEFITSYGRSAMEAIIGLILCGRINSEVVSEALRVIGRIDHVSTYRDRLWLLERGLYSSYARVRDGAIVGLAYLDDPIAIKPLGFAIEREQTPELRKDMEQVLSQLQDTLKWRTS